MKNGGPYGIRTRVQGLLFGVRTLSMPNHGPFRTYEILPDSPQRLTSIIALYWSVCVIHHSHEKWLVDAVPQSRTDGHRIIPACPLYSLIRLLISRRFGRETRVCGRGNRSGRTFLVLLSGYCGG